MSQLEDVGNLIECFDEKKEERERERDRERDRETERDREREIEKERETEREGQTARERFLRHNTNGLALFIAQNSSIFPRIEILEKEDKREM